MRDIEITRPEPGAKHSNLGVVDLFLAIVSQSDEHMAGASNGELRGRCDQATKSFSSEI